MQQSVMAKEDKLPELNMPFDPPADRRDPYPDYARCRSDTPVILGERGGLPLAWVFRHEDVATTLQDYAFYSNDAAKTFLGPALGEDLLVGMDPPEHARYRKLIAPAFGPSSIVSLGDTLISSTIGELLDNMEKKGGGDIVTDLAFILPTKIMSCMLGLPERDFEQFRSWAMDIITVAGDPETAFVAADKLRSYLSPIMADRRANPSEDVISRLVHAEVDGLSLTEAHIHALLLTLLPAGIETTYRTLGNLMFVLLSGGHWEELVAQPQLVRAAIEEILRFEAPLQVVFRTAREDVKLCGTTIPAGTFIIPVLGSANRDDTVQSDPDRFDIHRTARKYLTFGNGVHTCLGMHLAKLELAKALDALIRRFPKMQLDASGAHDLHIRGLMVRSPAHVPVIF